VKNAPFNSLPNRRSAMATACAAALPIPTFPDLLLEGPRLGPCYNSASTEQRRHECYQSAPRADPMQRPLSLDQISTKNMCNPLH